MFRKILVLSAALLAMNVNAEGIFGKDKIYAGLKLGKFMIDIDGADDPDAFGFQAGYSFTNTSSLEVAYLSGSTDVPVGPVNVDLDVSSLSIDAVFRSEGQAYFLGKVGLIREEVDASASYQGNSASESGSDSGITLSLGGGFRLNNNFALEAEYTIVEEDIDFLGISANVSF